jgi:hypothetical protein
LIGSGGISEGLRAALGNLNGNTVGAASGFEGMGLRDRGPGGGGELHSYGIGNIKALSHGRDFGSDRASLHGGDKERPTPDFPAGPPETTGSLDPEDVRRVIRSHVSQIRFCYEQRLMVNPGLSGKLRVRFLVGSSGDVPEASMAEGTTISDSSLRSCILTRVRSWVFPSPKGGGSALVTYPIWLKPSGE